MYALRIWNCGHVMMTWIENSCCCDFSGFNRHIFYVKVLAKRQYLYFWSCVVSVVISWGDTNVDLFRLVKSKAILKTIQCRAKISQDIMDILIGYKTMNDFKQETITDREILWKMKSFPKQRFFNNDWQQLKSEIWVH